MKKRCFLFSILALLVTGCSRKVSEEDLKDGNYDLAEDALVDDSYEETEAVNLEYQADDLLDMVIRNDVEEIKLAIENGIDIDKKNEFGINMLMEAARSGHKNIIELLLENGSDPNKMAMNGEIALLWAVDEEYVEIIEILIDAGSDVNNIGNFDRTPLWVSCRLGNVQIAKILLENGADPTIELDNEDGSTPISLAKDKGLIELVEILESY